jgi:pyridinium-3,5-bisthiocarboxylic acid mononucleotide nickel chelatase
MKKGRPAHTVSALADPSLASQVGRVLLAETGSLGVRGTALDRWPAARQGDTVEVDGLPVRVKVSPGRVKVEHDDAARVARLHHRPLRDVLADAESAARRRLGRDEPDHPDHPDDPDRPDE